MAVNSISKIPSLQVHQNADAQEEKERLRQSKKDAAKKDSKKSQFGQAPASEEAKDGADEIGQILDSAKTIELIRVKSVEPKTLRKHAFLKMTQLKSVNNSTLKTANKLNKSA